MSWNRYSSGEASQNLAALRRALEGHECCITYSPVPGNAKVTVIVLPDWEAAAMAKDSSAGRREIVRFSGVTNIKTTTQDTIAMGDFESLECACAGDGDTWRFVLKDTGGGLQEVEFSFSECELDLSDRRKSINP